MRDVRGVFAGFAVLAIVAAVGLVVAYAGARRLGHPERWWRAVRAGALGTIVGVVVGGVIVLLRVRRRVRGLPPAVLPGGSYLFDPATDRLVQLFPFEFWSETTIVVGVVIVAISLLVAFVAGRRARRAAALTRRGRGRAGAAGRAARVGGRSVNGVPIARIFGIEIRLHLSWIFIVAIITVTVGSQLATLPPTADETLPPDATLAWAIGIAASLLFMLTVIAHELAHALVERRFGMKVDAISVHFIGSPAVVDVRARDAAGRGRDRPRRAADEPRDRPDPRRGGVPDGPERERRGRDRGRRARDRRHAQPRPRRRQPRARVPARRRARRAGDRLGAVRATRGGARGWRRWSGGGSAGCSSLPGSR